MTLTTVIKEALVRVIQSTPKIEIESVHPNGDVMFKVNLKDLGLFKQDFECPFVRTRFFVNFVGEFLVRSNVPVFADILTGLDPSMYNKIVSGCKHTDFGMFLDKNKKTAKWQMHISLVQQILTEDFDRILDFMPNAEDQTQIVEEASSEDE